MFGVNPLMLGGGKSVLIFDTFTDSNRNLTAHTPDLGNAWSSPVGSAQIVSNKAQAATLFNTGCVSVINTGASDVVITGDIGYVSSPSYAVYLHFRYQDSSNYLGASLYNNTINITKYIAGTLTTIATAAFTSIPGTYTMTITCAGNNLSAVCNGSTVSTTLASLNTATSHGIGWRGLVSSNYTIDNFKVEAL